MGHALSASYGAPGHHAPSRLGITASGLPLTADVRAAGGIGRDEPFPDSCIAAKQTLFDHLVCANQNGSAFVLTRKRDLAGTPEHEY